MSVHTAEPGDIYRDSNGNAWHVRWICREPTVCMERLYPGSEIREGETHPAPVRQSGGVSGLMWNGFTKLEPRP